MPDPEPDKHASSVADAAGGSIVSDAPQRAKLAAGRKHTGDDVPNAPASGAPKAPRAAPTMWR